MPLRADQLKEWKRPEKGIRASQQMHSGLDNDNSLDQLG